jgi:hypothetical protein
MATSQWMTGLIVDEDQPRALAERLTAAGWKSVDVRDLRPLLGEPKEGGETRVSDPAVAGFAADHHLGIVTSDRGMAKQMSSGTSAPAPVILTRQEPLDEKLVRLQMHLSTFEAQLEPGTVLNLRQEPPLLRRYPVPERPPPAISRPPAVDPPELDVDQDPAL